MVGVSKHQVSLTMNHSRVKNSRKLLPPDSSILEWRWSRCKNYNSTPGVDPCLLSYANKSGESFEFKRGESPKQSLLILLFGPTITGCWKLKTTAALFCVLVITLCFNFSILLLRRWNNGKRLFFISELIFIENATQVATCNSVRGWVCKNAGFLYHNQWWIEAVWKSLPWGVLLLMRRTQHGLIQSWRTKICWPRIFHS